MKDLNNGEKYNGFNEIQLDELILGIKKDHKKSRMNAKLSKCILCKKEQISFCESHTIPRFVLKNISDCGYVYRLLSSDVLPPESGLKNKIGIGNTDVFYDICKSCDGKFFQDYESKKQLLSFGSAKENEKQRMMVLISLKNALRDIYQDLGIVEFTRKLEKRINSLNTGTFLDMTPNEPVEKKNYEDHMKLASLFRDSLENSQSLFKLCYYKKIHHNIDVASQTTVVPHFDFKQKLINDVYDLNAILKYLFICLFPLGDCSLVFVYCFKDDWDTTFKNYFQDFNKLKDKLKYKFLLGLCLAHSDQVFFSERGFNKIKDNEYAKKLAKMNCNSDETTFGLFTIQYSKNVELDEFNKLPDLIS